MWAAAGFGALFVVPSLFGSSDNDRSGGGSWWPAILTVGGIAAAFAWWNSSKTASAAPTRPRRTGDLRGRGGEQDAADAALVIETPAERRDVGDAGTVMRQPSDVVAVVDAGALRDVPRPEGVAVIEDPQARQLALARIATERSVIL